MTTTSPCRLFFALFAIVCLTSTARAQHAPELRGRVIDGRSGDGVGGATVSIAGVAGFTRSDRDGVFTWRPVPPTPFQIIVVLVDGTVARPVIVDRVEAVNTIRVDALAHETVAVPGAAPSITAPPGSAMSILADAAIVRRTPDHLVQALETVAGIAPVSEGHAVVPAIRGLARGRTLLLIDGARVNSERRVGPSATFLDPLLVERIDVSRGAASVAYGSDALGGVISIRTRRAAPDSALHVRGSFTLGASTQRGGVEISKGFDRGGVLVHVHRRHAEDYRGPEGTVFNSGWEDEGFLVSVNRFVGRGQFVTTLQSDLALNVERPRANSRAVRIYNPFERSNRWTASYETTDVAGFDEVDVAVFLGRLSQKTVQDRFATATTSRRVDAADVSARDFQAGLRAQRILLGSRVGFGVDVNGRYGLNAVDSSAVYDRPDGAPRDTITESVHDAARTDAGVYVDADVPLTAFARLSGGARGDRITTRNDGGFFGDRSTSKRALSGFGAVTIGPFPSLGALRHITVTTQASRGFRDPVLSDRYFRGPTGRGSMTGNPDLNPERSRQFDTAVRYTRTRTQLAGYFYTYRITDLIERYAIQPDVFVFRNRGRARLRGVELESRTELPGRHVLEISGHFARGIVLDDGSHLADIAAPSLSVLGGREIGERGDAYVRLAVRARDDRPGPGEVTVPAEAILDSGGGWRLNANLEVRGVVRNLLNRVYAASADTEWVHAPGRSAHVSMVLQF